MGFFFPLNVLFFAGALEFASLRPELVSSSFAILLMVLFWAQQKFSARLSPKIFTTLLFGFFCFFTVSLLDFEEVLFGFSVSKNIRLSLLAVSIFGVALIVFRTLRGYLLRSCLLFFFGIFSWGLLFFIDNFWRQQIFAALSVCLFWMLLWGYARFREETFSGAAKSVFSSITVASAFLFLSVLSGIFINYTFSAWIFSFLNGLGIFLLTYQYLACLVSSPEEVFRVRIYSAVSGICFAQSAWMVQFWPFGYLTIGAVLLIFYYVLWDFLTSYVEGSFTRSRVLADIWILFGLTALVLATTRWTLVQ